MGKMVGVRWGEGDGDVMGRWGRRGSGGKVRDIEDR